MTIKNNVNEKAFQNLIVIPDEIPQHQQATIQQHQVANALATLGDNLELVEVKEQSIDGRVLIQSACAGAIFAEVADEATKKRNVSSYLLGAGAICLGAFIILKNLK